MHRQDFHTADLKDALERSLGFRLKSIERIGGGSAINFKAERMEDGLVFVVKCYPSARRRECERLAANLAAMTGAKTPVRLFAATCPVMFAGYHIVCLAWCQGAPCNPCRLTDSQWSVFIDDYTRLSECMQVVKSEDGVRPLRAWWSAALGICRGLAGRILRPALEAMSEGNLVFVPELTRTIHGDFHKGNILFSGGEVECFMDFESLRAGYPAEDIVCYCIDAAKECGRSDQGSLRRILSFFKSAVSELPYSPQEWHTAINALFLMRLRWKTDEFSRLGMFTAFEMAARARLDDMFRQQICSM